MSYLDVYVYIFLYVYIWYLYFHGMILKFCDRNAGHIKVSVQLEKWTFKQMSVKNDLGL